MHPSLLPPRAHSLGWKLLVIYVNLPEIFLCTDKHKGKVHQKNLFIYFFVALGLCCFCCREPRLLIIMVCKILTAVASLVAEHRLWVHGLRQMQLMGSVVVAQRARARRLSSRSAWAPLLHGIWNLPRPGIEPMSPALVGRFLATVPPREVLKYTDFKVILKHG